MRIEHIGLQTADPDAAARWYEAHLGFETRRGADEPHPVRFISDESGRVMIEIYRNPSIDVPEYSKKNALELHLAFVCDEVDATVERLVAAGASLDSPPTTTPAGDRLAMLRDPWGLCIQLCHRARPMV